MNLPFVLIVIICLSLRFAFRYPLFADPRAKVNTCSGLQMQIFYRKVIGRKRGEEMSLQPNIARFINEAQVAHGLSVFSLGCFAHLTGPAQLSPCAGSFFEPEK